MGPALSLLCRTDVILRFLGVDALHIALSNEISWTMVHRMVRGRARANFVTSPVG